MAGMISIFRIDNITLPFLFAASLRSMDPALEEAGRASGMSAFSTFSHVNFKLLTPTIFAVLLLLIVRGIETFEVPAVIGLPAEVKVYASEIFLALRMFHPPDYNLAGTYSIFYLVVASIGVGCTCGLPRRRKIRHDHGQKVTSRAPYNSAAGAISRCRWR